MVTFGKGNIRRALRLMTCGSHIYGIVEGQMRIAQKSELQGDENVLTKPDAAKVMSGICPRCGQKLEVRNL